MGSSVGLKLLPEGHLYPFSQEPSPGGDAPYLLKPLYQEYSQIASKVNVHNYFVSVLWHNTDFNVKIFLINTKTLYSAL